MEQNIRMMKEPGRSPLHLGTLVCRHCGEIIDTLPTSGVKLFYGECGNKLCSQTKGDRPDEFN
ncbi:GapA-binding peptide SR1P [Cohnella thermotolerans]|uniref:GapA-binding peptide SR1P n=1 Tax=Cohnella thermotolerans TaxID=329858 RepID=UPI0004040093|nr:GapA-binding peptide SR1P [Cohnella thermotolerans]